MKKVFRINLGEMPEEALSFFGKYKGIANEAHLCESIITMIALIKTE